MYSVEADKSKRFFVISAAGHVTRGEVKEAARQVREIVEGVKPGFRVLTDFRWLDSMEPAAARYLAQIMDALAEKKVGLVARVVPDPRKDIGLNILSQFHYGSGVRFATFESLAEALQLLAENED